jgi:predicted acetyltransferase
MFLGQPGAIDRTELGWRGYLRDLESRRKGRSEIFYAVHRTEAGDVDGYASYRIKGHWEHGIPAHILTLRELIGLTQQARAALWTYCMSVDLVVRVEVSNRPVDDPIQWMLADPRRLRTTLSSDFLWVRLVDIPAALAARRYAMEGRLVLDIADPFLPENSGRYLLEGGPDGAVCQRSDGAPDVALDVSDLGALFLGGVAATTLARAGRIQECRSGAVRLADAMFLTQPAPWCITEF